MIFKDYYKILGLETNKVTAEEIKIAYREQAKKYHPDVNVGNKNAEIMFIGEGPGADEDRQGEPFVGRAGKLMNMAFDMVGIKREEVYIANIVKCRPPANRNPEDDESYSCMDYLRNQVLLVKPKIIVLLRKCGIKKYTRKRIFNYNK